MPWLNRVRSEDNVVEFDLSAKRDGKRFPKRELNTWLKDRIAWNNEDWLTLLDNLDNKGFHGWVNTKEAQDQIGLYLETNRKSE